MSAAETGSRTDRTEWLSLGEASRTLGVNTSTLRRWADADLVRTFRTPGGHRRFSASDLDRLMGAGVDPAQELDDEAIASIRERLTRDETQRDWLDRLQPGSRRDLGELGRQMVQLLEAYVAPNAPDLPDLEQQAGAIGRRYADLLHQAQVSLTEAVTAFAYFRRGMDEALRAYARRQGIDGAAADSLWDKSATLEDCVLVALTAAYEQQTEPVRVDPEGQR
ncbi:MAG TPA: MerR family transcriptional regulator [Dehalococcoidia bacterium]|nr:MerR family transcriptional regulator [Dehalococcoidia bacterium]